jgi:acetylornithine deacetylase
LPPIDNSAKKSTEEFLKSIISIPSVRGKDGNVTKYIFREIKSLCDEIELRLVGNKIKDDPDYAFPILNHTYDDTSNLYAKIRGTGGGKSIVFNTHVDVVPPSPDQDKAFNPYFEKGLIFGRGACDAKGQIATLYALMNNIKSRNVKFKGDVIFHFVIEEECGGNGTLAMVRQGLRADAAIVMEPSEFAVIPSVRGAVWFEGHVYGKAGHSGRAGDTVSAIKLAYEAMWILEKYHDKVLAESKGINPLFDEFENPMPITFGEFQAGNWPASTPSRAVFRGVFGFLPNKNRTEIMKGMQEEIRINGSEWLKNNFIMKFNMLHSDGNVLPVDHELVTGMVESVKKYKYDGKVTAMTASCDAWLYNNVLKIPTIVFGPGSLKFAHSKDEQIALKEINDAADILLDFVTNFCN